MRRTAAATGHWPGYPPVLASELQDCRAAIARHLNYEPRYLAFPYGSYNRHTLRALGPAGYQAGLSVHGGPATPASDLRRLPRLELTAATQLAGFQRLVATGYPSEVARLRAGLRNWAYRVPWVKDALLGLGRKLFLKRFSAWCACFRGIKN